MVGEKLDSYVKNSEIHFHDEINKISLKKRKMWQLFTGSGVVIDEPFH